MQPDKYQQAVIDEYCRTNNNIFISATAGAGKTSTLVELSKRTPPTKNSIFLAFNKSIAEELGRKLPPTIKAMTLHSCALANLRRVFDLKFNIKENKYWQMAKDVLDVNRVHFSKQNGLAKRMCDIFDLMRFNLVDEGVENVVELAERYGVECDEKLAGYCLSLHRMAKEAADRYFAAGADGTMPLDFTDMLVYAVTYIRDADWKRYSVVMCDESQDISPLQYRMIQKLKTPRGRLVAVGDEKQAIYSFQGSNLDSLNAIKNAPNTVTLPLSMTYRCAKSIVKEAEAVFPNGIEAAPTAIEGAVTQGGNTMDAQEGDFILCRNNAPLVETWIKLIKAGKRCTIMGKEFGDELISLMENVNRVDEFESALLKFAAKLKSKGIAMPEKCEAYEKLNEKIWIILDLVDYFGSLEAVRNRIYDIFVENADEKSVILSTIHKSKGLEADRVFFLKPELLPSKYATTPLALYAEKCLQFVAITRARKELIYAYK